jgi:hypothetical protein
MVMQILVENSANAAFFKFAAELTCLDFATWRLLSTPHCQVCVPKMDDFVVYCPSLILLDAISIHTVAEY